MKEFVKAWKRYLRSAFFFSIFVNLFQLTFPIYMLMIYDKVLASYSTPTLIVITIIAVCTVITMGLLDFVRSRIIMRMSVLMDRQMSEPVLKNMIKKAVMQGKDPSVSLKDVMTLRNYLSGNAIFAFFDLPWTPIFIALIFTLHPLLGCVALAGGIINFISGFLQDKVARKPLDEASMYANQAQEFVSIGTRNAESVRSMGMVGSLTNRWNAINDKVIDLQIQASASSATLQSFTKCLQVFMQISVYGVGAWLALTGRASAGVMIAASIIMGRALAPIQQGMSAYKQTAGALRAFKNAKAFFDGPQEKPKMELPAPQGALSCENIHLTAPGNRQLLAGVNFKLAPGESLGLIGPSGAGKSTLCRMLTGLWMPTSGAVRLDEVNLKDWDKEKLGPHIGYLPQDIELFSGTIAENIARLQQVDSEAVIKAAKLAGIHEMVLHMPKGYDTPIGRGGVILSGGQRQRVGLARALYGNPKLIILDEPSSNLDEVGEQSLQKALDHLRMQKATVIVVSHKMSTLASMDKLLLIQDGKMMVFGKRRDVLAHFAKQQAAAQQQAQQQPAKRPVPSIQPKKTAPLEN